MYSQKSFNLNLRFWSGAERTLIHLKITTTAVLNGLSAIAAVTNKVPHVVTEMTMMNIPHRWSFVNTPGTSGLLIHKENLANSFKVLFALSYVTPILSKDNLLHWLPANYSLKLKQHYTLQLYIHSTKSCKKWMKPEKDGEWKPEW